MKTIQGVLLTMLSALAVTSAQGQISNLTVTKIDSDNPSALRWTSVTNAIYRIEYSTNLLDWLSAENDFPAQGTNTIWTDYGSETAIQPRPSSTDPDALIRFYRLAFQGYMSNQTTIAVTISNLSDGAVISSLTNVVGGATSSESIIAQSLLVDGNAVQNHDMIVGNPVPLETRFYPNGTHRLTFVVENDGDTDTTGGDDPVSDLGAGYGIANIAVTFSNFLSDFHVRYRAFRPDLGQIEEVYATWASPRSWKVKFSPFNDLSTEIRSFMGCGTKVLVQWDGKDSLGNEVNPQLIAVQIIDLGVCSPLLSEEPPPGDGGGGDPPGPMSASGTTSETDDWLLESPPLPWDTNYWSDGTETAAPEIPAAPRSTATWDSAMKFQSGMSVLSEGANGLEAADPDPTLTLPLFIKTVGTAIVAFQGHHPTSSPSNRPQRGAPFGQATMTSALAPPWRGLRSPYRIQRNLQVFFPLMGYSTSVYGDDGLEADDLRKSSLGGNEVFNEANIGLFIGHSGSTKENIVALGHPQSYIPVYNKTADTITWVGMNDMDWGSDNLKWMAFYSCNMFRDSPRLFPCYPQMKNNEHLGMNTDLHIMQAFATENTVHPHFAANWTDALSGQTANAANHTVVGAWNYICRRTQPKIGKDPDQNIARSACWPECVNDFVYGYGPQTDPDPFQIQGDLVDIDATANDPEP
jgi:hypothetical protein